MQFNFGSLNFKVENGKVYCSTLSGEFYKKGQGFVDAHISGEMKSFQWSQLLGNSSQGKLFNYFSHKFTGNILEITQRSQLLQVTTYFTRYEDTGAVRIYSEFKNITDSELVLEETPIFTYEGLGQSFDDEGDFYLTHFLQSHKFECQAVTHTFKELGLSKFFQGARKGIVAFNVGSWSTKTELPQGIIEDRKNGGFTMFQIESNNCWYYEIGVRDGRYYLTLSGASLTYGGNCKKLLANQTYVTPTIALAYSKTLNGVLESITKYRRHIAGKCDADKNLPTVFNEYMHLSWDSPTAETTIKYAPTVAKTDIEYYVVDCGWHDEVDGNIIYPYVGKWIESNKRFPNGVKATADFVHSLGMKFGLWIEPEIIGVKCAEMLNFYDSDCFLQRNGKKIAVGGRYFLDFRAQKVREYLTQTITRMVNEYGAEYIKFDYNQDCGVGTDYNAFSVGEGLENACKAYLLWVTEIRAKFPQVIFETCSSGGMRMDYKTLSHFSIVSTSDQTNYKRYPYVISNMLSAVLPEQSAVWSYPVDCFEQFGTEYVPTREWVAENVTTEQVIFNMTNSFLGRMHLASHLELLSQDKFALVKEGVEYYNSLTKSKLTAVPYMPLGFTEYGSPYTASGMISGKTLYLVVWNLSEPTTREISLNGVTAKSAKIAYPLSNTLKYSLTNNTLTVNFTESHQTRIFEIELN